MDVAKGMVVLRVGGFGVGSFCGGSLVAGGKKLLGRVGCGLRRGVVRSVD